MAEVEEVEDEDKGEEEESEEERTPAKKDTIEAFDGSGNISFIYLPTSFILKFLCNLLCNLKLKNFNLI
jgi:hypothetical protein